MCDTHGVNIGDMTVFETVSGLIFYGDGSSFLALDWADFGLKNQSAHYVSLIRHVCTLPPPGQTDYHGLPTHSCDAPVVMSLDVESTLSFFPVSLVFYVFFVLVISVERKRQLVRKILCRLSF